EVAVAGAGTFGELAREAVEDDEERAAAGVRRVDRERLDVPVGHLGGQRKLVPGAARVGGDPAGEAVVVAGSAPGRPDHVVLAGAGRRRMARALAVGAPPPA